MARPKVLSDPLPLWKLLSATICIVSGALAFSIYGFPDDQSSIVDDIARGVGQTLVIIGGLDLLPEGVRWATEGYRRKLFRRFFGKNIRHPGVKLITAERKIAPEFACRLYAEGASDEAKDSQENMKMKCLPEGVESWIAQQDVRGASYVYSMLTQMGVASEILTDADVKKYRSSDPCSIAIGLGFNGHTKRVMRWETNGAIEIGWTTTEVNGLHGEAQTDSILVDGKELEPGPVDKNHYSEVAIVARIIGEDDGRTPHFVVAGRTADGTAVAGHYLANHWYDLAKKFRKWIIFDSMDEKSVVFEIRFRAQKGVPSSDVDSKGKLDKIHWLPVKDLSQSKGAGRERKNH